MMAKSFCRGMTAALLFVCAAPVANAVDHSLGSGNGALGNNISTYSQGSIEQVDSYDIGRTYASLIVLGFELNDGELTENPTTVLAPKAKIIDVDATAYDEAFAPRNGCVMESGVCVIRGDR
ncbi:hypothetical protein GAO09_17810 [Rhizobiales bacterium RZME27]|jgi:hypothetical protein|uniref:Uncharacterized protein n=1 Tax=Endobacterium cereale TaxID=2663029 RepID=A0A6A8A9D7_9HYPH|nr:hypothetical protein [Endobacterium cereale]MEB2847645.1 hypothetical protein [Endobacterium cereale]MQY47895.1 hypothetical protein [Endobacterium cereale]